MYFSKVVLLRLVRSVSHFVALWISHFILDEQAEVLGAWRPTLPMIDAQLRALSFPIMFGLPFGSVVSIRKCKFGDY